MRRTVAAVLPLLILNAAVFAQIPPEPLPEPAAVPYVPAVEVPVAAESDADGAASQTASRLSVNFEPEGLTPTPLSMSALDSASVIFARNPGRRYEVHGYSCPGAGRRLSPRRVERMVEHLMALGVPGENILTVVNAPKTAPAGAGECTEDRRVDIISVGTRWRTEEAPASASSDSLASMAAAMETLKKKLEEAERPEMKPAAPEPSKLKPIASEPGKRIVAVYMAGEEPRGARGVHNIVGGELARVMSESDKYTAVDRTEAILEQLDKEHVYQRSGAVDDDQIKAIGHQLGVEYLCISNINPVGKKYYLDTRLVDVITAEIARSVTATSSLKDANGMTRVGRDIALELLEAEKTRRQKALRKKIFRYTAIGLNALGAGTLAYGYFENNNVVKHKGEGQVDENGRVHYSNGPEAVRAATRRDAAYIVSGALIAAGVSIHIVF
jgi:hypothetical protein